MAQPRSAGCFVRGCHLHFSRCTCARPHGSRAPRLEHHLPSLANTSPNPDCDPMVLKLRKHTIVPKTLNPEWDESFIFTGLQP